MIKTADWILHLDPGLEEGAKRQRGVRGGEVVAETAPEAVAENARSFAGRYLGPMLGKAGAVSEGVG